MPGKICPFNFAGRIKRNEEYGIIHHRAKYKENTLRESSFLAGLLSNRVKF
jgi:hypothetical protein